jgi:hypothetical protein
MSEVTTPPFDAERIKALSPGQLASLIRQTWVNKKGPAVYFGAVPYLQALAQLSGINGAGYGMDSEQSIVSYFLSNATTYRGPQAKIVKAELKRRFGIK